MTFERVQILVLPNVNDLYLGMCKGNGART